MDQSELYDEFMEFLLYEGLEQVEVLLFYFWEQDVVLYFFYQKYDYILRLICEVVQDLDVIIFKIIFYWVVFCFVVVDGLLVVFKNGKQVIVFIEVKVWFDEVVNLYWGVELEKVGVMVIYSYFGIKVYIKLLLIIWQEEEDLWYYVYLGIGNFNEKMAWLYCDYVLFIVDFCLVKEVGQVFDLLEWKIFMLKCKYLLVFLFIMRSGFEVLFKQEIRYVKVG